MTNYAFKPADIPLKIGKNVLYLVNPSNEVHSMALRNPAVSVAAAVALSAEVEAGRSAVSTIENLPAGAYRVTVSDHQPRHRGDGGDRHRALSRSQPLEPRADRHGPMAFAAPGRGPALATEEPRPSARRGRRTAGK